MKIKSKHLKLLPVMLACTLAYAGNDEVPTNADIVLVNCKIQPIARNDPSKPFGKFLTLAIADYDRLHSEEYASGNIWQRFGLVFSGQFTAKTLIAPGVVDNVIYNKWRFISPVYKKCWNQKPPIPGAPVGYFDNIVLSTCNVAEDQSSWYTRDFVFTNGTPNPGEAAPYGAVRIREGLNLESMLGMFVGPDAYQYANMSTDHQDKITDFQITGCMNRNRVLVSPMKYNR